MADLGYDYNAEDYKPMENREPIPPGKYEAQIVESSVDDTKNGNGKVLKLVWQVLDGEFQGRKVFDRVNLANPNQQAVEIGQRQLSSICRAVGRLRIQDSSELHDVPCVISVKIRPAKGEYGPSNEINGYAQVGELAGAAAPVAATPTAPAPRQAAPRQPAATAAAPASGKPPWARK